MNLYAGFHDLIASILGRIAAQGRLPENLDLERFAVEPPRDPTQRQLTGTCDAI
jgi:arginyl-tRNA synthetase